MPAALMAIPELRQLAEEQVLITWILKHFHVLFQQFWSDRSFDAYEAALGPPQFQDDQFWVWSRAQLSPHTKCAI